MTSVRFLFFPAALLGLGLAAGCGKGQAAPPTKPPATRMRSGVEQLLETRGGQTTVWGVTIHLASHRFIPVLPDEKLAIHDDKYPDRDLKPIMTWVIEDDGHALRIEFKSGAGDFGSGDHVYVRIKGSAIAGENDVQDYEWEIPTDPL